MKQYGKRIADGLLEKKLGECGAVLVEGIRGCGKTAAARRFAGSILDLTDPGQAEHYQMAAEISPPLLLKGASPRLVDEWTTAENLLAAVRAELSQNKAVGRYILTGSEEPRESAGNEDPKTPEIGRIRMRPMTLFESGDSMGTVSLAELFAGEEIGATDGHTLEELAFLICRGGWPKAAARSGKGALQQAGDQVRRLLADDACRADGGRRDPEKVRGILDAYARCLSQPASLAAIRKEAESRGVGLSAVTLYAYLDILRRLYILEDAPAWQPPLRPGASARLSAARYFADPSIAAFALGVGVPDLLSDLRAMEALFMNLCMRDLRVYASALGGKVFHFQDRSGLSCGAAVVLPDGAFGLVNFRLGGDRFIRGAAEELNRVVSRLDTDRMGAPAFRMVLAGVAPAAYRRADGAYVVPAGCLKP